MSEKHANPGPDPKAAAEKAAAQQAKSEAKMAKAQAEKEAEMAEQRAEKIEEQAHEEEKAEKKASEKPTESKKEPKKESKPEPEEVEVVEEQDYVPKAKPELDDATKAALALRAEKKAKTPDFRRHEWWRYKKLGGKNASWRKPDGIHSKARRHFKYRPNVVSIGFRGPVAARGLHPSGFEDVLVHTLSELEGLDPKTQAARIGGTVGGRKAELIQKEADKLGIRILNRRS